MLKDIKADFQEYLKEFLSYEKIKFDSEKVLVIGCSTSEIQGTHIGKNTNLEVGETIVNTLIEETKDLPVQLAFQCCEHLNRSLVVERKAAEKYGWEIVNARPVLNAGGGLATAAYEALEDPVLVERIQADLGIDIGDTFIGMHVKHVQIPLRLPQKTVGQASIKGLYRRLKLIGGARAQYL